MKISEARINSNSNSINWKKHSVDFSKYTFVGVIFTLAYIFLMWACIDLLHMNTLTASCIIVAGLHVAKFITYRKVRLIHKQFKKYSVIQFGSAILNIFSIWLLIDILHIQTVVASSLVIVILFILRFVVFKLTRLTVD